MATGNSFLTVVYYLLSDLDASFCDLGPTSYESRINKHRRARDLAAHLQALTGQHTSSSATAKRSSPKPPPNPKPIATQPDPGCAGCLWPAHSPSDFRVRWN